MTSALTRTTRDRFWDAWEMHLEATQDPSEITIDTFMIAAEVIERWIQTAPEAFTHDGEIILEHMANFMDTLPLVTVKH